MGYVKIKIKEVGSSEDLRRWEEHMLEKAKCWNKFCFDCYSENEVRAVRVMKEEESTGTYLTTLCEDCIRTDADYGILINEKHLMLDNSVK